MEKKMLKQETIDRVKAVRDAKDWYEIEKLYPEEHLKGEDDIQNAISNDGWEIAMEYLKLLKEEVI